MKSIIHHITAILLTAAALCCSCSRSALEHNRGVVVSAVFSDTEDLGTQVSDLQLQFYNSSTGELALQYSFESAQELSLKIFSLPKGEYTVVLGANLSTPLSLEGTSSPSNLRYSLEGVSPVQAFSACGDHNIDNPNHLLEIKMDMNRFLCELAIEIEGAPDGLNLAVEAVNASDGFYPARKGDDGSYGTPSQGLKQSSLPPISLSSAASRSQPFILMPTALGREWSLWRVLMTDPGGKTLESYIEAPRMNPGGRYLISLEYTEIQSFMHLSPSTIEDWTQGWIYNGVITDPLVDSNEIKYK